MWPRIRRSSLLVSGCEVVLSAACTARATLTVPSPRARGEEPGGVLWLAMALVVHRRSRAAKKLVVSFMLLTWQSELIG